MEEKALSHRALPTLGLSMTAHTRKMSELTVDVSKSGQNTKIISSNS